MAPVGPVVGIVGGGQLARMLAEAASPMGIHVRVLASERDEGADGVVVDLVRGDPHDRGALLRFAKGVDVLTFDHENVDRSILAEIEGFGTPVRPSIETLALSDKAHQRRTFAQAGFPVPPFVVIDDASNPDDRAVAFEFLDRHGSDDSERRIVAKASTGGYDGRGVWELGLSELDQFLDRYDGAPLVLEPHLTLDRELAVIVARSPSGEIATWPVVETIQVEGMCDEVLMPAPVEGALAAEAEQTGTAIAESVGATGVFAVELFVVDNVLLINEVAPRVHNSGHVTIEASTTSQFEQHLRAILDWPLGPTSMTTTTAVMRNVVGADSGVDPRHSQTMMFAEVPEAHLHLYGKTARPGRKIGHLSVLGNDLEHCRARARRAVRAIDGTTFDKGSR